MSYKIHILSPELSNKIAAGEVVQRPAAAVKELIENSLDAKATRISVIVRDAGKALIQVVDDGEGMSEQDASLAFRRHATSKIRSAGDLEDIRTLGFRGEALASIAAVSQVELKTRTDADDLATHIRIEGSETIEKSKSALERGTNITVRNLFYNTPARRNFLKTRHTELKNITDVIVRMAIAYPEVEWFYASDDEVMLDLKAVPIDQRVTDVFGKTQFGSMIKFESANELLTANGFLGKPNFARKSRIEQFVFLNRRFIFSRMINHAVFQAYEHLLEKGSFPFFMLNLTIDPKKIDVNVHPSKMEVKFENESNIYRMVLSTVRKALAEHDLIPSMSFRDGNAVSPIDAKIQFSDQSWKRSVIDQNGAPVFPLHPDVRTGDHTAATTPNIIGLEDLHQAASTPDNSLTFDAPASSTSLHRVLGQRSALEQSPAPESRPIWQAHNKYIISQIPSGLMIIDQHAAHERILYERVMANFENTLPSSQQLLFPETVDMGASDYALVKELLPDLVRLGFDMRLFGKNTVVIDGIPADVRIGNEKKILHEVLDEFKNNEHAGVKDVRDNLAKSFACKAAIKAGDRLNMTEMVVLIEHLFLAKVPYVCPHGRPVIVRVPLEELDKRFGRT
ncbi:MAG: DNA mismatch repair endonuclease MutL [Ignavibacteriae bacterium]|nr:MAG: DNA mismatch repair endonuclease MutL [Ignavibacteriota bacterium]